MLKRRKERAHSFDQGDESVGVTSCAAEAGLGDGFDQLRVGGDQETTALLSEDVTISHDRIHWPVKLLAPQ